MLLPGKIRDLRSPGLVMILGSNSVRNVAVSAPARAGSSSSVTERMDITRETRGGARVRLWGAKPSMGGTADPGPNITSYGSWSLNSKSKLNNPQLDKNPWVTD